MDSKHVIGLYEAYQSVYEEGSYSAKEARKGEDIGKPGKMFKKIEQEAAKRYGSEESGKRVAGAVLAKLRREEVDLYDVVLEHLLDEGYCDDVESAEIIMTNMSEEWLDGILESIEDYSDSKLDKSGKTAYKASQHLVNRHQRYLGRNMGKMHPADREEKFSRMRGRIDSRRKEISKESDRREDEKIARTKAFLKSLGL